MKKLFVWILSAALCVSLAACTGNAPADETPDVPADEIATAYQNKVAELEAAGGETLTWVQFPCGTGEKILVVTKESSVYGDG